MESERFVTVQATYQLARMVLGWALINMKNSNRAVPRTWVTIALSADWVTGWAVSVLYCLRVAHLAVLPCLRVRLAALVGAKHSVSTPDDSDASIEGEASLR